MKTKKQRTQKEIELLLKLNTVVRTVKTRSKRITYLSNGVQLTERLSD